MENIDDFMQRKFDSDDPAERFPFREEYWEQAQALIEADEQRRRKRRRFLFWWWCSGLLIGAGAVWLWFARPEQGAASASGTASERPGIVSGGTPGATNALPEKDHNAENVYPVQPAVSPERESNKNAKNIDNQLNRVVSKVGDVVPGQQRDKQTTTVASHRIGSSRNKPRPVQNDPKTGENRNGLPAETNQPLSAGSTENTTPAQKNAATMQGISTNQVASDIAEPLQMNNAGQPGDSISVLDAIVPKEIFLLQALDLPFPPASRTRNKLLLKKMPKQYAADIKPVDNQRITFDAGISVSSWKNGSGYSAGVMGYYPLDARWSLGTGLQLRYFPLAAAGPEPDSSENVSVQYRYSFGFERTEKRRTAIGLQYLELPLAVQWRRGRLGLEAGAAPGVLLQVRDRVTETRETSLSGVETLAVRKVRGEKTNFRRGSLNTFIMAEWQVVSGLGLTFQGNYRPGSVRKPVENTNPDKDVWGFDAGLHWRF